MNKLILVLLLISCLVPLIFAAENIGTQKLVFNKTTTQDYKLVDVNTISAWVTNYGSLFRHPQTGNSGFEWPARGGVFAIYATGLWVGARVEGSPRVAIAEYSYEYKPGKIIDGVPADPNDSRYQVYKWLGPDTPDPLAVEDGAPEKLLGDQFLWSVYNDGDPSYHVNAQTAPLYLEVQQSVFAFARTNPLGNTVFMKWLVVNKSGRELVDTYISVWADPDLGGSGDDFVGCDTILSLGYCYNSDNSDTDYGDSPPAVGIDFFQGPIVPSPGDTAYVSGQMFVDYKNLPMTSFLYYNNSNENNGNPQTGPEVYNYMQGRWRDGRHIVNDGGTGIGSGPETNFMYPGDPEAGTGWLDSSPADRRFMMTTGPFTLQPWEDTNGNGKEDIGEPGVQEIVAGAVIARGTDNLNSATLLKQYDAQAQLAYDLNFNLASPPRPPVTSVTLLDKEIVLNWSNMDPTAGATYAEIESYSEVDPLVPIPDPNDPPDTTYDFQGYRIYQYDYLDQRNKRLLSSFDIVDGMVEIRDYVLDEGTGEYLEKLVWRGSDNGITRHLTISEDRFSNLTVPTLINGKRYWFGVVAWGYNEASSPKMIESPLVDGVNFLEVVPQAPQIGTRYDQEIIGDVVPSSKEGVSDGSAYGVVVDPTQLTGHEYKMEFANDADGEVFWKVTDLARGVVVLDSQYHQAADTLDQAGPIVDGIRWQAMGPSAGFHGMWQTANGNGPIAGVETEDPVENIQWINFLDQENDPTQQAAGGWFFVTHGGGTANDQESFIARVLRNDNWTRAAANIFEMRFTAEAAANGLGVDWGSENVMANVPFEIWNLGPDADNTSDDFRMIPQILNDYGGWRLDAWDFGGDDPSSGAANDPATDWVYWGNPDDTSPGQAGFEAAVAAGVGNPATGGFHEVLARTRLMNWNGYASHSDYALLSEFPHADTTQWDATDTTFMYDRGWFLDPDNSLGVATVSNDTVYGLVLNLPEVGTVYRWITNKPNAPGVSFTFQGPAAPVIADVALAKSDLNLIKVYPNPYYGTHSNERIPTEKWVEFTHLPPNCTIRIFNLAGLLIRTLRRTNVTDLSTERWDLQNESDLPVASGLYIYHIDIPGIGEKIGKMVIFMPEERLDQF